MRESDEQTLKIHWDVAKTDHPDWVEVDGHRYERRPSESNSISREKMGLALIGRDRAVVDGMAGALYSMIGGAPPTARVLSYFRRDHHTRPVVQTRRGSSFEVLVADPEGQTRVTGHVLRVTVELDRFDGEAAEEVNRR